MTFHDQIISLVPSERRSRIGQLSGCSTLDPESLFLNELVHHESKLILEKKGQKFNVKMGVSDKRKFRLGNCYPNSVRKMREGFNYVEGYIVDEDGSIISHSWNVDGEGNHFDFTFKNPEKYEYFGIIVPDDIVWEVGLKNGGVWYCVLPFVDNEFNYKVD